VDFTLAFELRSRDHHVIHMADTQLLLNSHNRLCLTVSSALGSTRDLSQLLVLKSEAEEMLQLVNEVRHSILISSTGGVDVPGFRPRVSQSTKCTQYSKTVQVWLKQSMRLFPPNPPTTAHTTRRSQFLSTFTPANADAQQSRSILSLFNNFLS